jgi:2-octaprenyl-6-methoxyphenol hydroxylase
MANKEAYDYDILIIGGGMVGASLACALQDQPLRIGVIEAVPYQSSAQPSYDDRVIALAYGSGRIFAGMGLWDELSRFTTPIHKIHVSDRGHFGVTRMDAAAEGVEALGYVVTAKMMGTVLSATMAQANNIDLICPAQLSALELTDPCALAHIQENGQDRVLKARLVVAADGGKSVVREFLEIDAHHRDYGQTAIIATVSPERPHQNVAYERFTDCGPLAMLPMQDNHCSLVWTQRHEDVPEILTLNDDEFLDRLQQGFGYRLGKLVRIGTRNAYPLHLIRAKEQVRQRMALIGNAAHTLHPIAGQGFNLGIRDVAVLAEVIVDAHRGNQDYGQQDVLNAYAQWRQRDHRNTIGLTDFLVSLFSNKLPPLALARNLGLVTMDILPPVKRLLSRQTMGLNGRQTRLARGLHL